jgi:16S rRNA processing protein RimM
LGSRALLAVGKIVKPFGIRGEVVLHPMTENLARFKKLKRVFIGKTDVAATETTVLDVVVEQRGVRIRLDGIADRTAAEQIVGSLLFVDERDAVRLPKGAYFIHDLLGMNVVDEQGTTVGVMKDVLKYPAHDVYVVGREGKEFLIPAVKEFIRKIDVETRTMRVRLIEGMLDETSEEINDAD